MADEWFRTSEWSAAATDEFEARLRRARPHNQSQYLRIKALALIGAGRPRDGAGLLHRIVADNPDSLDARFAHELLGDFYREEGRLRDAEAEYRVVLVLAPDLSGTTGELHVALGEVLFEQGGAERLEEIASLLTDAQPHMRFNSSIFRWRLLAARTAEVREDPDGCRSNALAALDLVGREPQFARHPTVGRADPSLETIAELQRLAGG